jgi:hypothetical protein
MHSEQPVHLSCPSGRLEFDRPVSLTTHLTSAASGGPQLTPIGFLPLRRFGRLSPLSPGLPHPVRSTFRLSQPPSGFLLNPPQDSVSCLKRPWGLERETTPHSSPCSSRSRSPLAVGRVSHPPPPWSGWRSVGHRKVPSYPISTSGVSPDVSPFTCLWCYPRRRADPLVLAAL